MATTAADRVSVDTNVLLSMLDGGRRLHRQARIVLDEWPASGIDLYTSGQVLRELLCVATRPVDVNGLGLGVADAVADAALLGSRLTLVGEGDATLARLFDLLGLATCSGRQVDDAHLVATMLVHGIAAIVTANVGDFARYRDHITVLDLADV